MDPYATSAGPIDSSVLYDQEKHVSSAVWEGQVQITITFALVKFYLTYVFIRVIFSAVKYLLCVMMLY